MVGSLSLSCETAGRSSALKRGNRGQRAVTSAKGRIALADHRQQRRRTPAQAKQPIALAPTSRYTRLGSMPGKDCDR